MGRLSIELERLLADKGWSQKALSEASGVDPAVINRTMRSRSTISDENYRAIVIALTADPMEQAVCQVARLQDLCRGPGEELVEVRTKVPNSLLAPPRQRKTKQVMLERAESYLHHAARQKSDVSELIIDLAVCLGMTLSGTPVNYGPTEDPEPRHPLSDTALNDRLAAHLDTPRKPKPES